MLQTFNATIISQAFVLLFNRFKSCTPGMLFLLYKIRTYFLSIELRNFGIDWFSLGPRRGCPRATLG